MTIYHIHVCIIYVYIYGIIPGINLHKSMIPSSYMTWTSIQTSRRYVYNKINQIYICMYIYIYDITWLYMYIMCICIYCIHHLHHLIWHLELPKNYSWPWHQVTCAISSRSKISQACWLCSATWRPWGVYGLHWFGFRELANMISVALST